ncbi:MAG TPA: response regulator [Kofleriaceae bacterium]|nr:response regulator [Kofleriaceae bacterium]
MTPPSSMTAAARCAATVHRWPARRVEPARMAAVSPTIAPHRSALPRVAATEPRRSADGDRKQVASVQFVLIVDDDPDLLDVTSFVIENEGMAVETARNGQEALALIGTGRLPALVLLDLMMPVMNGWEFLAAVANDPLLHELPVVVLTAAERAEVPGALAVLSKPMDLKELLRIVEHYVHRDRDAGV